MPAGADYDLNTRIGGASVALGVAAAGAHESMSSFHIPDVYVFSPPLAESTVTVTAFARDQFGNP
jgi:hypothetical protein|eukprot:COSAG01_NODE_78_length_28136_cov_10.014481_6_plen_65_part_00